MLTKLDNNEILKLKQNLRYDPVLTVVQFYWLKTKLQSYKFKKIPFISNLTINSQLHTT